MTTTPFPSYTVRMSDERVGRAHRELHAAVIERGGFVSIATLHDGGSDWAHVGATVQGDGRMVTITERGTDLAEAIDRVRDRINREDWDR